MVSRNTQYFTVLITTVKITCKARQIVIKGPRGEIKKDLSHLPIDIRIMKMATGKSATKNLCVRVQMWNAGYKQSAAVGTFTSVIKNAFIGVTEVSNLLFRTLFGT